MSGDKQFCYKSISELNCISEKNAECANYQPKPEHQQIDFYITRSRVLITVGRADNNYIYWLSITSTEDRETNRAIFDLISVNTDWKLSHLYQVLQSTKYQYEDLQTMYQGSLTKSNEPGMAWKTPFGHYYGISQESLNGIFFAKDIAELPEILRRKCIAREANGNYYPILKEYLHTLKAGGGSAGYYLCVEHLIDIIREEKYLLFSEHDEVRAIYLKIDAEISDLYQKYMASVR